MLLRCTARQLEAHHEHAGALARFGGVNDSHPLTVGRLYLVLAVCSRYGLPWFFVETDADCGYPIAIAAPFWTCVDNRPSRHWRYRGQPPLWAPAGWCDDPLFYEHLVDGKSAARAHYLEIREVLTLEFSSPDDHLAEPHRRCMGR